MNYGLARKHHLMDFAVAVCDCLGYGKNNNAHLLLIKTSGAETNKGSTKDRSIGAGMGITQIDKLTFEDIKKRCKGSHKELLLNNLGVNIDLVEWGHLRYNPFMCFIFTRLKYKKVPEVIPTSDVEIAQYWKKNYNSCAENAKGTVYHFLGCNGFDMSKYSIDMEIDEKSIERVKKILHKSE